MVLYKLMFCLGSLTLPNVVRSPPARRSSWVQSLSIDVWLIVDEVSTLNLNILTTQTMVTTGIPPPYKENSHSRAGNRTLDLVVSSQKLWPLDREAGLWDIEKWKCNWRPRNRNWYHQRNWNENVERILLKSCRKTWMTFDQTRKNNSWHITNLMHQFLSIYLFISNSLHVSSTWCSSRHDTATNTGMHRLYKTSLPPTITRHCN
jgi:hypothetical protein